MELPRFDLDLFMELNEQYSQNSAAVEHANIMKEKDDDPLLDAAVRMVHIDDILDFKSGMRVLEIGCGRGYLSSVLHRDYGCEVVGVDIRTYPDWEDHIAEGLDLRVHDISQADNSKLGTFDRIFAIAVWEHMEHPYASLEAVKDLLRPGGHSLAFIVANLYRGPKASHRYRDVYFPWPHLLFDDEVFVRFFETRGRNNVRASWVNKLTVAHYETYLRQLDFEIVRQWTTGTPIDEEFYQRFVDRLGRYPRFDLENDFIHLVLGLKPVPKVRLGGRLSAGYLRWRLQNLGDIFKRSRG